jgi:hypothetical protein
MKQLFSFLLFVNIFSAAFSQNFHLNLAIGAANYYGDLQSKRYTFKESKGALGIGLSYEINDNLSLRTGLTFAKVSGDDKLNPQTQIRNLNFTSSIAEVQIAAEYYLINPYESSLAPYLFAGVAAYHFNPYTYDTSGTKFFLQPLSTEGQGFYPDRKPYKLTQLAIPFGGGVKLALSENINVSTTYVDPNLLITNRGPKSFELAFRENELKTSNPYPLGDIRGGEKYKDWYYFTMLTASFRLGNTDKNGGKSKVGCPTRVR